MFTIRVTQWHAATKHSAALFVMVRSTEVPELDAALNATSARMLSGRAEPGVRYRVECKDDLSSPSASCGKYQGAFQARPTSAAVD